MVASTVVPPQTQPPPDVPSIPGQNANLTSYLRRFSVWATGQLANRIPIDQAVPSVMFVAPNKSVWKLSIDNNGNFISARVPLGGGRPTTQAMPVELP